jgi:hypothetical protein
MKITIFKNMKGLIHGRDPKRIRCDVAGTLKIGKVEVNIIPTEDSIMPKLFNGTSGDYEATFTTRTGVVYNLDKVAVRGGWIQPPPPTTVELMELRCRADAAEEKLEELAGIFDTNSLNFLIK